MGMNQSNDAPTTNPNRTLIIVLIVIASMLLLAVLGVVALGGIGAYFIRENAAEHQKAISRQDEEARRIAEEKARLDRQLKDQSAKIERLLGQLSSAKDEASRLAIQKQIDEVQAEQRALRGGGGGPRPSGSGAKPCACAPGDPLCSCL
jgi:colicin import membrane protein